MLCQYCRLIDFSQTEPLLKATDDSYRWASLPPELRPADLGRGYYAHPHHTSLSELFQCSVQGCHFCVQIRRELYHIRGHESREDHHQGYIEIRFYTQEEKEENGCRKLEIFAVAVTPIRDVKLTFGFIRPPRLLGNLLKEKAMHPLATLESEENFELARTWMQTCSESHTECIPSTSRDSKLPTRVLEVISGEGSPCLRLMVSGHLFGRYATLSHVWGRLQIITTNLNTLQDRLKGISPRDLPNTFYHAVVTTRKLGFRYLWIDSLCIIQDSKEDWSHEASLMGQYYQNSAVTIAVVSSKDGDDGFFFERDPLSVTPCPTQICFPKSFQAVDGFLRPSLNWDPVQETTGFQRPPLWQRAWVLQERILSPRLLQFSSMQMSWKCRTWEASERVPEGTRRFYGYGSLEETLAPIILGRKFFGAAPNLSPFAQLGTAEELLALRNAWFDLVTLYGKCGLTIKSDIFPAISGIARLIANATGDTYYAGIWASDIHRGLMWSSPDSTSQQACLPHYRAPSWSWASVPASCSFIVRQLLQNNADTNVLQIRQVDMEFLDGDSFGQVRSGVLHVSGLLKKGQLSPRIRQTEDIPAQIQTGKNENTLFDLEGGSPVGYYYADTVEKKLLSEVYCLLVWTEASQIPSRQGLQARGLALRQLDEESGVYLRVGAVWITDFEWYSGVKLAQLCIY